MAKTYNEFVTLVRNWANRDDEVLSNSIVSDCLEYAVAQAYRVLRISELEQTVEYTAASLSTNEVSYGGHTYLELSVPSDLVEYIQIRRVDDEGGTVRVYNERADVRTFHDLHAEKYSRYYWTRIGSRILITDTFDATDTDTIEVHYYGKLGALNERWDVTAVVANTDSSYINSGTPPTDFKTGATVATGNLKVVTYTEDADPTNVTTVYYETSVADGDIPAASTGFTRAIVTDTFYGELKDNWFRDENERILLYGALSQVFIYLNEPDTAQMYGGLFTTEINQVTNDENRRRSSGGNLQININGGGLI